jgi:hypothetical protein
MGYHGGLYGRGGVKVVRSPKTHPISGPNGLVNQVWATFFDQQDSVKVRDGSETDNRALAGEKFVVLDGSTNTVTYTLPQDQRPTQRIPETGTEYYIFCKDSSNACSIALNGSTFYSDVGPLTMVEGDCYYLKFDGTKWIGFKGTATGGVADHNDLDNIQGSNGSDEYYHLTLADHTEAVAFLDGGTATHTGVDAHIADSTIHFTIIGTPNEIELTDDGMGNITIGLPDNVIISNNLTVQNDNTVNGDIYLKADQKLYFDNN